MDLGPTRTARRRKIRLVEARKRSSVLHEAKLPLPRVEPWGNAKEKGRRTIWKGP